MKAVLCLLLFLSCGLAQGYEGNYQSAEGFSLELAESPEGLTGSLTVNDVTYKLTGFLDETNPYGFLEPAAGSIFYFELELDPAGQVLTLLFAELLSAEELSEFNALEFRREAANPLAVNPLTESVAGQQTQAWTLEGEAIQAERQYQAASRLMSVGAGVSFVVPEGHVAGYNPQAGSFMVASLLQGGAVMVDALSRGSIQQLMEEYQQGLNTADLTLVLQDAKETTTSLSLAFTMLTSQGQGFMDVRAVQGATGNLLILTAIGTDSDRVRLNDVMDSLIASSQFAEPGPGQLASREQFAGMAFRALETTGSNGGSGNAGGSSKLTLDMCRDGRYAYAASSSFVVSIPGAGASAGGHEVHSGSWELGADLMGIAILLSSDDGRELTVSVQNVEGQLFLEGVPVFFVPSERCS